MLRNHLKRERHVDDPLVGTLSLGPETANEQMLPVIWAQGGWEQQVSQTSNAWMVLEKTLWESFAGLWTRCRIERMRVQGQQRKRDGINNETFIKVGGTRHILRCTCGLLMQPLLFVVPRVCTTQYGWKQPLPYWHFYAYAPTIPRDPSLHCWGFLFEFITTFFSFMLSMFSLLTAWLDKCVYGISHVYKITAQATV